MLSYSNPTLETAQVSRRPSVDHRCRGYAHFTILMFHLCWQARIHPYFPYFHVDMAAEMDLFSPAPGHTISTLIGNPAVTHQCCSAFHTVLEI